ncbi:MAG: 2TM domain-containing protein [Polyangiales bacterium]
MSSPRRFSDAEVEAVLRHALAAQRERGGLTRDELLEAARGVGLDAASVDEAIATLDRGADDASLLRAWRARRRRALTNHAIAFTLVNALLYALDRATPPDDPWFYYPLVLWGIALALDVLGYLRGPSPDALDALRADARTGLRCAEDPSSADADGEQDAATAAPSTRAAAVDRPTPPRR